MDVYLINSQLENHTIKNKLKKIKNSIVISTRNIKEFREKAIGYSKNNEVESIYAVGGDSTVNTLASILINTDKKLGIIPIGKTNRIYNSIKNNKYIDIGYINEYIFLNHAILFNDANFSLSFENRHCFKELNSFEIACNIEGKYKILEMNALVISNGYLKDREYDLLDKEMETYIIRNNYNDKRSKFYKTKSFNVDALGNIPICIDGNFHLISKFDFKVADKKLELAPIEKKLELIK